MVGYVPELGRCGEDRPGGKAVHAPRVPHYAGRCGLRADGDSNGLSWFSCGFQHRAGHRAGREAC